MGRNGLWKLVRFGCAGVECVQCLDLGLQGTAAIIVGSTFDWADILCYALGCSLFAGIEYMIYRYQRQ